jgi:preprotein translocase subunit SecB
MKPKITPEEYRNILSAIELDTLYLIDLNSKQNEEISCPNLQLDIQEKHTFAQEGSILKINYSYKLAALEENTEASAFTMSAKYVIRYNLIKDVAITKDFMSVFSEMTLGMLLWPYFRELVNNTIYRMGLPPLVLPLKKI